MRDQTPPNRLWPISAGDLSPLWLLCGSVAAAVLLIVAGLSVMAELAPEPAGPEAHPSRLVSAGPAADPAVHVAVVAAAR